MFEEAKFEDPIAWIGDNRRFGWDALYYAKQGDDIGLSGFLQSRQQYDGWDTISCAEWHALVDYLKVQRNWVYSRRSSWRLYKERLKTVKNYEDSAIAELEQSVTKTLDYLHDDIAQTGPVKGMVVGNVQSGKTGHMAGLMCMAADEGYNMFIVLSGLLESLRDQTEVRLIQDLISGDNNWTLFRHPGTKQCTIPAHTLDFSGNRRYFTVCLKNPKRLQRVIKYLQQLPDKQEQMKILVIEDEADQAGVNTNETDVDSLIKKITTKLSFSQNTYRQIVSDDLADLIECNDDTDACNICQDLVAHLPLTANANKQALETIFFELFMERFEIAKVREKCAKVNQSTMHSKSIAKPLQNLIRMRTRINELLGFMIEGRDPIGRNLVKADGSSINFKAMNYIAYTATPYANLLNEPAGEFSLFPKDFILPLKPSNEYFGPQHIFGCQAGEPDDLPGLDIVRPIGQNCLLTLESIHNRTSNNLPDSLKNSIMWFYCCAAYWRFIGYKTPISMLIHTSAFTDSHASIATAIESWIASVNETNFVDDCRNLWNLEIVRFDKNNLQRDYPMYSQIAQVKALPTFDKIKAEFVKLLPKIGRLNLLQIQNNYPVCCDRGINYCVDDSKNDIRIKYPSTPLRTAPAYIVIGGATLSRGLTFEGLVCSYFSREVSQCDTLMQMGRWFGYRKGYELLPRIWVCKRTRDSFEKLTVIEKNLRDSLSNMVNSGLTPAETGVKLKNTPSWITLTASNKMQAHVSATVDFVGLKKQTVYFDKDATILQANINTTTAFLKSLGICANINSRSKNCRVWTNVDFATQILGYLQSYKYWSRNSWIRTNLPHLDQWIQSQVNSTGDYGKWNVILAGTVSGLNPNAPVLYSVGTVERGCLPYRHNDTFYIKGVSSPNDLLADVDLDKISDANLKNDVFHVNGKPEDLRDATYLKNVPQLIIYVIDKNSAPQNSNRQFLNSTDDIVSLQIYIPGDSQTSGRPTEIWIDPDDHNA